MDGENNGKAPIEIRMILEENCTTIFGNIHIVDDHPLPQKSNGSLDPSSI